MSTSKINSRLLLICGLLLLVLLAGLALPASRARAEPDAPLYYLNWDVVASGSSVLTSTHYVMRSTTGQAVIGTSKSAHYILHSGYWYGNSQMFMPLLRKK